MEGLLEKIYKRYNQFGEYEDSFAVLDQYTMIRIYKEGKCQPVNIETIMKAAEIQKIRNMVDAHQELLFDSMMTQPKSVFYRMYLLEIVARAIPNSFYERIDFKADSIVEITMAITLYYWGLQTYRFSGMPISDSERRNLIGREDFYFGISEIQKVRGKTTKDELEKYLSIFAKNIDEIKEEDGIGLYEDGGVPFIICIEEYLDYMIFVVERYFRDNANAQEYSYYTDEKGSSFEEMVYGITKNFVQENYQTLYYYPNDKQKIELDVLLKDGENLAILECKSGTFSSHGVDKDDALKLQIHNKTKKAYSSLKKVSDYLKKTGEYSFSCGKEKIVGRVTEPICIHVSMYPMDFIASNMYALFPEYFEESNPIFTISMEHLFAMLLDAKKSKKDIFDYWKQRQKDILQHPGVYYDNNELDLYYEIVNSDKGTMLAELRKQGILEQISPNARIVSSFHNEFGEETRPALWMLRMLDTYILLGILEQGKNWYGVNKRYLKNLEEYIRIG
ncbi:MAG: hypothetical protein IJZ23_04730 [Roseburia sp.]|nr:hypothetical protein [Roseburia sp.]